MPPAAGGNDSPQTPSKRKERVPHPAFAGHGTLSFHPEDVRRAPFSDRDDPTGVSKNTSCPQGCSQIKYTERIIAQCNKIIRGSPRAAKERFKRRREGTAGKLPTGREHPHRRNPHPPRLRKSLKERGWVRAALAGLGRRKGNAGVFPPSSESFPSPSPIFSFTAQASAAAGWGNACPRGERGRVRRRWSRRATPRPSAAG